MYYDFEQIPDIKVKELTGRDSIIVVRTGIVMLKEERAYVEYLDMGRIEDEHNFDI